MSATTSNGTVYPVSSRKTPHIWPHSIYVGKIPGSSSLVSPTMTSFIFVDCDSGERSQLPSQTMRKDERLVGYAFYFYTYSTWEGRVIHMEDLFVREEYRGKSAIQ